MADKAHVMAVFFNALGDCWGLHNDCWGHHGDFYRHTAHWLSLITWGHHACTYKPATNCDVQVMTGPHETSRCATHAALISQAVVHAQLYKQAHCISSSCKSLSLLYSSTCALLTALTTRIAAAQLHAELDLQPRADASPFAAPWRKKNSSVCKASTA